MHAPTRPRTGRLIIPQASAIAKRAYVRSMHACAWPLRRAGLLARLEGAGTSPRRRWLRSLFAIHDIDDMIHLDLAWWTFDALDRVSAFLAERPAARVFEYGSGASTVWLAQRSTSLLSVEHDPAWHALVRDRLGDRGNTTLLLRPPERPARETAYGSGKPGWTDCDFRSYVAEIDCHETDFDLIVIDGRARAACLGHAIDRLAPGGMIVFDNSARGRYRAAIDASGLAVVRTRGLTAALPYPDETSLMARDPSTIPARR